MKRIILCVLCLCFFATVAEAAQTTEINEKFQRGRSQKDLYNYLVGIQTDLTDLYTDYRVSLSHFYDGKTTGDFLIETDQHVKMTLKSGFVQLVEVPDSSTDTITVTLYNHSGAITDTLTFTEGTDSVGEVKAFTVQTMSGLEETSGLRVVVGGTTTTAGEVVISTEWKGSP